MEIPDNVSKENIWKYIFFHSKKYKMNITKLAAF